MFDLYGITFRVLVLASTHKSPEERPKIVCGRLLKLIVAPVTLIVPVTSSACVGWALLIPTAWLQTDMLGTSADVLVWFEK